MKSVAITARGLLIITFQAICYCLASVQIFLCARMYIFPFTSLLNIVYELKIWSEVFHGNIYAYLFKFLIKLQKEIHSNLKWV